jgi:hypothetical protein
MKMPIEERRRRNIEYIRRQRESGYYDIDKSFAALVECRCPRCNKLHRKLLNWSGGIPAKIYCKKCDLVIVNYIESDAYDVLYKQ